MELKCPHCGSVIYSRKNKLCGVCERPLPEELLFSDAVVEKINQEIQEIHRQRKEDCKKEEEKEKYGGGDASGIAFF